MAAAAQVEREPTGQAPVGVEASVHGAARLPEEAKLEWFFSAGQSLFEASTFGGLLERQATFGQKFEDCWACLGTGFAEDDSSCKKCRGMGGKPVSASPVDERGREIQRGLLFGTTRCEVCIQLPRGAFTCNACDGYGYLTESGACCLACKGTGSKLLKSGQPRKRAARRPRPEPCWSCGGARYHTRSPVGIKPEERGEASYTPDDHALQMFAQVSRWLMRCSDDTVDTLAEFFGLSGYLWGNTRWGRLFAVVPLTPAGERTLAKLANPQDLSAHRLLSNHVHDLEKAKGTPRERAAEWLELVTRQAAERFQAAAADWCKVVAKGEPLAIPRPTSKHEASANDRLKRAVRAVMLADERDAVAAEDAGVPLSAVRQQVALVKEWYTWPPDRIDARIEMVLRGPESGLEPSAVVTGGTAS